MAHIDPTTLRFAGFMLTPSPELRRGDKRIPRFVTAHRFLTEYCVYSHEINEPGHWDKFRLDRSLKDLIPEKIRFDVLHAVSRLTTDSPDYGQPNVCMSRDAVRALLAASRLPRDAIQILEAGVRISDVDEVLSREDDFARLSGDKEPAMGIVAALRAGRAISGDGTLLGVEPWYLDRRLRQSWRERHDTKAVRSRAFSRLNEHGLLCDMIDFELFVPGLTPRKVRNRDARWIPVVIFRHTVESMIGDVRPRSVRAAG